MDRAGRLVIPKKIRQAAGVEPGWPLTIRVENGKIEIEPEPAVRLVRKGSFLVAVPTRKGPPLTLETVNETIRQFREKRASLDRDE